MTKKAISAAVGMLDFHNLGETTVGLGHADVVVVAIMVDEATLDIRRSHVTGVENRVNDSGTEVDVEGD